MATEKIVKIDKAAFFNERSNILKLLASNPKLLLADTELKLAGTELKPGNTYYEELKCVGYNPNTNKLFATFEVKREFRYSGPLCTAGSYEHLRFFINYGSGWLDQGSVSVNVHDIPTQKDCAGKLTKPVSYTATIWLQDVKRNSCKKEILPQVKVILSWSIPIPPNNVNYPPVWGNSQTCKIQIKPWYFTIPDLDLTKDSFIPNLLTKAQLNPDLTVNQLTELVNLETGELENPISLQTYLPKEMDWTEAVELAQKENRELDTLRLVSQELVAVKNNPELFATVQRKFQLLPEFDLLAILDNYEKTKADVSYEELTCLGLDYNVNRLTATSKIKRHYGYVGDLCHQGGKEYIAFWADWNDDCKWTYLGTSAVEVHNLRQIDKGGICYSVSLYENLEKFRKQCSNTNVVKVRAVLSWFTAPSTTNPEELNTYGNRLDEYVQLKPTSEGGDSCIAVLGGIPTSEINAISGLTTSTAKFALNGLTPDSLGRPCPFDGRIVVQGIPYLGKRYKVSVRNLSSSSVWTDVVTPIRVVNGMGFGNMHYPHSDGYFDYLSDYQNIDDILAWWNAPESGLWEVRLQVEGTTIVCIHRIRINKINAMADISISAAGGPGTGNCQDYQPGDPLNGTFVARSPVGFFKSYSLYTNIPGPSITQIPAGIATNPTGVSGDPWTFTIPVTTKKCGYYVGVTAYDRTIIDSTHTGRHSSKTVGLCVR